MKNYFKEGELVTLNKELPNKPTMMVFHINKKPSVGSPTPFNSLIGIECIWFTPDWFIQSQVFNFKDLISLEDEDEDTTDE